jgi:hypothetical protein
MSYSGTYQSNYQVGKTLRELIKSIGHSSYELMELVYVVSTIFTFKKQFKFGFYVLLFPKVDKVHNRKFKCQ